MTNSRNEMNECFLELLCAAIVRTVQTPERVVLEHVLLIAILHANVGTEIGNRDVNLSMAFSLIEPKSDWTDYFCCRCVFHTKFCSKILRAL